MAAPQRQRGIGYGAEIEPHSVMIPRRSSQRPVGRSPERSGRTGQSQKAVSWRAFFMLVIVPVALMMGSVYVHTVSARIGERTAALEERLTRAEGEGRELEVRVSELSSPERIRSLAGQELRMVDAAGARMMVLNGGEGELSRNGAEKDKKEGGAE